MRLARSARVTRQPADNGREAYVDKVCRFFWKSSYPALQQGSQSAFRFGLAIHQRAVHQATRSPTLYVRHHFDAGHPTCQTPLLVKCIIITACISDARLFPTERAACLIFDHSRLEEITFFLQVDHLAHPRERIFLVRVQRIETDLLATPITDEA